MLKLKARLDDLVQRLHRYNEADDARQRQRPARWHVGRVIFGAVFLVKSAMLANRATGYGGLALAAVAFAIGTALIVEGTRMLLPAQRAKA